MISRTMSIRSGGEVGVYSLEEVRNMTSIPEVVIIQIESVGDGYFLVEQRDCRKNKLLAASTIEDKIDALSTKFKRHAYGWSHPDEDTDIVYIKGDEMSCLSNFIDLLKEELKK